MTLKSCIPCLPCAIQSPLKPSSHAHSLCENVPAMIHAMHGCYEMLACREACTSTHPTTSIFDKISDYN